MQYPTPDEVGQSLQLFRKELGNTTDSPFRVDMAARYGGKPSVYTVMFRCAEKGRFVRKSGAESQVQPRRCLSCPECQ